MRLMTLGAVFFLQLSCGHSEENVGEHQQFGRQPSWWHIDPTLSASFLGKIETTADIDTRKEWRALYRRASAENYSSAAQLYALAQDYGPGIFAYHPEEERAVRETFARFGDLYVAATPEGSETIEVPRPWAGYWFPRTDRSLFDGTSSPLKKLDRILSRRGLRSGAADWETQNFDPGGAAWEGLCDAWAFAAMHVAEPTAPKTVSGETLSVQDQKALWTKLYQRYDRTQYGVKYLGNDLTDGTYQDLRPEALHRVLLAALAELRTPFVLDDSAGIEVWSKPAFKYRYTLTRNPSDDRVMDGRTFLYLVTQRTAQSNDPTNTDDVVVKALDFRLYLNPSDKRDGGMRVVSGEWTGQAVGSHPDFVWISNERRGVSLPNPVLEQNWQAIFAILSE